MMKPITQPTPPRPVKPRCDCGRPAVRRCPICSAPLCSLTHRDHMRAHGLEIETVEVRAERDTIADNEPIWITTKWDGKCLQCERKIDAGETVLWFTEKKRVACYECGKEIRGDEEQI